MSQEAAPMTTAISTPAPNLDDSIGPILTGASFYGITIPDGEETWTYYTQDKHLYDHYAEKGFCNMNESFRDQFHNNCADEARDKMIGHTVLAVTLSLIASGFCFVFVYDKIQSCLKMRRLRKQRDLENGTDNPMSGRPEAPHIDPETLKGTHTEETPVEQN